jgi:LmbE family N-acetylglucosaminyl deacetylase
MRYLIVTAHPDDADYVTGGSAAVWASQGHEVIYLICTKGEAGFSDPGMSVESQQAIRMEEQNTAAAILGVRRVEFLDYPDGLLQASLELRRDITRVIRLTRPDIVMTSDPLSIFCGDYLNHPDHRAVGEATLAAVFPSACTARIFPELLEEGLQPHHVRELYIMWPSDPNIWIDISEVIERKIAALRAHRSQVGNYDIGADIRRAAAEMGRPKDISYAEAFQRRVLAQ